MAAFAIFDMQLENIDLGSFVQAKPWHSAFMRTIEFGDGAGVPGASFFTDQPSVTYRGSGKAPKGASEYTKTDKNRARRQKKAIRRSMAEQRENRLRVDAASNPRKRATLEKRNALRELQNTRGVTVLPHLKNKLAGGKPKSRRDK